MNIFSHNLCLLSYTSNEDFFFPIWHKYYSKIFNSEDIYIINNNPKNKIVEEIAKSCNIDRLETKYNQDFEEIFKNVNIKVEKLLEKYHGIFIAETDEILYHPKGLLSAGNLYIENSQKYMRALGYEPVQDTNLEQGINTNNPILKQRKNWREASWMRKIVFITRPCDFYYHMHNFDETYPFADYQLTNIHLKFIDYDQLNKRNKITVKEKNFSPETIKNNHGWQNRIESQKQFDDMFRHAFSQSFPIPEKFKEVI